jgi:lipid-binding SYLF domain-containing protein
MAEKSVKELEEDSKEALIEFYQEVSIGKKFLENAKGYVIFPDVKEIGFGMGGKYAEGVLRVGDVSKGYFKMTAASLGFQMGAQQYSLVIAFTSDEALNKFITDDSWESDADFNIAMAKWGLDEKADDIDFGSDMVGFVFDTKGMMGNFTMEGTKFERFTPDND